MQIEISIKEVLPLKEGDRYPATEQRGSFTYESDTETINSVFANFVKHLVDLPTDNDEIPF